MLKLLLFDDNFELFTSFLAFANDPFLVEFKEFTFWGGLYSQLDLLFLFLLCKYF